MTAGSLPSMPATPIGQTSLASIVSVRPASRIWRRKRARLVAEPIRPTKPKRSRQRRGDDVEIDRVGMGHHDDQRAVGRAGKLGAGSGA